MLIICKICKKLFKIDKNHRVYCSDKCKRIAIRHTKLEWNKRNPKSIAKAKRKYYFKTKLICNKYSQEYQKNWRENNKEKILGYKSKPKKYKTKFVNKLINRVRTRTLRALKGIYKAKPTIKLLGCSALFLKSYLEHQFTKDMTWNNYGLKGWHIDHIRPCCSFDLSKASEQCKCFHYSNLQPLWAIDNLSKGGKTVWILQK